MLNAEIWIEKEIHLSNAIMIMGLGGWGNAGDVSTFTVKYLTNMLNAEKFTEIQSERFHNYLIQRPLVSINEGRIESYVSPRTELFYWNKEGSVDMVLLSGYEPHLRWTEYIKTVIKIAMDVGVKQIYTLGGYLADVSHEHETPISASTNNEALLSELEEIDVQLTNYKGPTSVYSELMWAAREKIDVISLWCAIPIYIRGPYPKAAYSLLKKIVKLAGLTLDLTDLKEKAKSFKIRFERGMPDPRDLFRDPGQRSGRENEPTYFV